MNGNITQDGIAKDLAWMSRVGIGGVQNFDASLITPQVVDERLVYMTPEWIDAFRFAVKTAEARGLEFAIAGSPGWSETGGPWVPPDDGIKKLVWSEIEVSAGGDFDGHLPSPPTATGGFQSMSAEGALGLEAESGLPRLYKDVAVLAAPLRPRTDLGRPVVRVQGGGVIDAAALSDFDLEAVIDLGAGTAEAPPLLSFTYEAERTIQSATLQMRDARPSFDNPRFTPVLEARVDGAWRPVARFDLTPVPTTVAFAPVTAREYRVVFGPYGGPQRPAQTAPAPGVITPPFIAPDSGRYSAKVAELRLSAEPVIDHFEAKAGYSIVNDYFALSTTAANDPGVPASRVVDLTDRLRPDGRLDWTPPPGDWRVIRLGWSLTGKTNHPASPEATGLEVDKLDAEAVERYLRRYLANYREAVGPELMGERGVRALLLDSTEVGAFNWTPDFIAHFRRLRGYDPTPWLPTVTGLIIGSREESDRFLYDFRLTLSELHATEHYATVVRVAHEYGLKVYGEALEDQRPVLGDDMDMRRYADVPMAALWTWSDAFGPRPTLLGDLKGASSVAHLYGRPVVAAESMTSALSPWSSSPSDLRRVIDLEFAHGVNLPIIHTSVHQPLDKAPGLSLMIFGQFFNRLESWGEMARPWIDYIARSSFLLQQGRNVADVAYFYGEEAPLSAQAAFGPPAGLPRRYGYDYVNATALKEVLTVRDGDLVAPSGARYRVLFLGAGSARMSLETLRRIAGLVEQGATVVGPAPVATPGLTDDQAAYDALVRRLWTGQPVTRVGRGQVIADLDVEAALMARNVPPDLDVGPDVGSDALMFVHRSLNDGDLYFVVNRTDQPQQFDARFRVSGKAPELWSAETGLSRPLSFRRDGEATVAPLELGPEASAFVLFRQDTDAPGRIVPTPALNVLSEFEGGWDVAFQPGRGAPSTLRLERLASLTEQSDPAVRYFSGEATYKRAFTLPADYVPGSPLWVDLGEVGDLAEVTINGRVLGGVWHAPFRLEIGDAVRPGENVLEVKVANLWVNRLIGDAQPGVVPVTSTTIPTFNADAPLRPSGLIGPVRLLAPVQ